MIPDAAGPLTGCSMADGAMASWRDQGDALPSRGLTVMVSGSIWDLRHNSIYPPVTCDPSLTSPLAPLSIVTVTLAGLCSSPIPVSPLPS